MDALYRPATARTRLPAGRPLKICLEAPAREFRKCKGERLRGRQPFKAKHRMVSLYRNHPGAQACFTVSLYRDHLKVSFYGGLPSCSINYQHLSNARTGISRRLLPATPKVSFLRDADRSVPCSPGT